MHPVHPDVDVIPIREITLAERAVLLFPDGQEPADRAGAKPRGVLPEQGGKRLLEVPRAEAAQIEHRQHLGHFGATAHVGRQDLARKPLSLSSLVYAPVVDPGSRNLDRSRPERDSARPGLPVANHQRVAPFVSLAPESLQVGGHFGLERRLKHAPGPLPGDFVERERHLPRLHGGGVRG